MNQNWKKWIYIILAVVVVGGFFYIVLEKEEPEPANPDTSQEENQQQEEPEDKKEPEEKEDPKDSSGDEEEEVNNNSPRLPEEDTDFATIEIGEKLPDFTLKDLDGQEVNLRDLEGKLVLINFWATWCPWCDKEMADLDKLDKDNEDLIVIGVNVDESKAQAQKYVEDGGYDFKVVLDEGGVIASKYLVTGLPASYFVNEEGIYVGRVPSYMTAEQMNEALQFTRDY